MNILLKDSFSWCCVSGIERNLYRKPVTKQKMQWVSLPSASTITDSEIGSLLEWSEIFQRDVFSVRNLPGFLPAQLLGSLPDRLVAAESWGALRAWPQVEFLDRSDSSPTQRQTDSWFLQGDPGLSTLVRLPKFEMHIQFCIDLRNLTLNGKFWFLINSIQCLC